MKAAIRLFAVAAIVASTVMVSAVGASGASAVETSAIEKFSFDQTEDFTNTSLCDFPIEVTNRVVGVNIAFGNFREDGSGREVVYVRAQDRFTANGTTLVGDWYQYKMTLNWEDFEPVTFTLIGWLEKVRLPDGRLFFGFGWIDLLSSEDPFPVVPDRGVVRNQDAFCAALST